MDCHQPDLQDLAHWLSALDGAEAEAVEPAGRSVLSEPAATAAPAALTAIATPPAASVDTLFAALYAELKAGARSQLRKESAGHTLSATALTHEAWFRLSSQTRTQWAGRGHFLAVAAIMMRRILVNHALARQAQKREGALVALTLTEAQQVSSGSTDVVRVHDALLAFEAVDARAAKVVELKFFGGFEVDEIADLLGLSSATVKRDWTLARAWLHRELAA
ncbi:MAG: ECF-type sigma factor [Rubrivivax sp.]